jgi:hypothetical protein
LTIPIDFLPKSGIYFISIESHQLNKVVRIIKQ